MPAVHVVASECVGAIVRFEVAPKKLPGRGGICGLTVPAVGIWLDGPVGLKFAMMLQRLALAKFDRAGRMNRLKLQEI